jgi:DDE family transposase
MTGDDVCRVFAQMLPQDELDRLCQECGVIERQRKLHLGMLVRALVMSAGTPGGADQADVLRSYLECEVPPVTRAAFYRWFDTPLEQCRAALAERALAYARAPPGDLPGPLSGVKDWSIVDSTTVRVRDALIEDFRGAGAYAALKVHKVLSVGCGAPVRYPFSPAREHDSPHLQIDASWRGYGLLADLASASLARLRACETYDGRCVMRLKDHWKPTVDSMARGQVTRAFFPGTDLDARIEAEPLVFDGRVMDADVQVGGGTHPLHLRRVGVQTSKGAGFFLTNLPPRVGPRQVADRYRVRWEVEVCQTQPVQMTWCPLRLFCQLLSHLRGGFKREHIMDVNRFSRDDDFADPAVGDGLTFFQRERFKVMAQSLAKGLGMVNDLLPMTARVPSLSSLPTFRLNLLPLGRAFLTPRLPRTQVEHLGLRGLEHAWVLTLDPLLALEPLRWLRLKR